MSSHAETPRSNPRVVTDFKKVEDGNYYMVTISGVTPAEGGMVQSFLTVSTDAKGGETIKIPFTAVIRKMNPGTMPSMPTGGATPIPAKLPLSPSAVPASPDATKPH